MAVKSSDQITIVDLTDAYGVTLTCESHNFPGTTNAAKAGSVTTQIIAMRGGTQRPASVTLSEVTKPSGVTVTKDSDPTSPTLTISVDTTVTTGGTVRIPVHIDDVTLVKDFTFAIAFTGATGSAGGIWYTGTKITGTSTTATVFSGSGITSATVGDMYLNTSTMNTYRCTVGGAASVAKWVYTGNIKGSQGNQGNTGLAGSQIWTTTTAPATPNYTFTISNLSGDANATIKAGDIILYSYYRYTVSSVASTTVLAGDRVSIRGATGETGPQGDPGADAITMVITSSNGDIFKNSAIETTLTAHVYQSGAEVTGSALTALGTIRWYKDGSSTAAGTGQTLIINAGDVTNKAVYEARLEA